MELSVNCYYCLQVKLSICTSTSKFNILSNIMVGHHGSLHTLTKAIMKKDSNLGRDVEQGQAELREYFIISVSWRARSKLSVNE